jgi:hypothetical protein
MIMHAENHVEQVAADPFTALAGLAPDLAAAMFSFAKMPYAKSRLSLREFEAARIRTADINGCMVCQGFRAARDLPGFFPAGKDARTPELLGRGPVPDEAFYRDVLDWRQSTTFPARCPMIPISGAG